jgi:hypothetical protein
VGLLTAIPALGTVCLMLGIGLALVRGRRSLLLFLIPLIASEAFVALAGMMRGDFRGETANPILLGFLAAQLIVSAWIVYRCRAALPAALLLAIFSISYALFAAFVAAMSFSDDWL